MTPLISIIIVNFNCGRYLEKAMSSVFEQSFDGYELIVVDGGSTDNSVDIIEKYKEKLAWWVSEPDKGQSDAFNKGFSKATGEFFMWLNADDLLLPGGLEAVFQYLKRNPNCKWLTCDTVYFNSDDKIYRCIYGPYWNSWLMKQTQVCNLINGPSSIFHRALYEKVGGMDVNLHYVMDLDLWIKFVDIGAKFHKLHRYIWAFRIHEGSKSTKYLEKFKQEGKVVLLRTKRVKTRLEIWCLRIFKILTGTHFKTIYDTLRWRGESIERFINSLIAKDDS